MTYQGIWNTITKLRNDMYDEILNYEKCVDKMEKFLRPVLSILDEHNVPIKSVHWNTWWKEVTLEDKVRICEDAYNKLCALAVHPPVRTVNDGYISFNFTFVLGGDRCAVTLENGKNSCDFVKHVRTKVIPEHTEEVVEYEADCTGVAPRTEGE